MLTYEDDRTPWYNQESEQLVETLASKVSKFGNMFGTSALIRKILRNVEYYHGAYYNDTYDSFDKAINFFGDYDEQAGLAVNHLRSLLQTILTYATADRPTIECIPVNQDLANLEGARIGDLVVEYYLREKGVEEKLRRAAEQALVLTMGFVSITWDYAAGGLYGTDEGDGSPVYEGDIRVENPTIFDVVYDHNIDDWHDLPWVLVRRQRNKHDLAAQYPDLADDIYDVVQRQRVQYGDAVMRIKELGLQADSDDVDMWEFFLKPCPSAPQGRHMKFIGDVVVHDGPLPYDHIPVYRIIPDEVLLTSYGYSPGFDLQGLQEALNSEFTTILSNHAAFGMQHIWVQSGGSEPSVEEVSQGLSIINSDFKPEGINFTNTPSEIFKFSEMLVGQMEYISGVNQVARGQPQPSLKSGTALALIDYKAQQAATPFIASFNRLLEDVATGIIKITREFAVSERMVTLVGKHNQVALERFRAEDLNGISTVTVDKSNPITRTKAGRVNIAEAMLQAGIVRTSEEFLTVLETGRLEPLYESDKAQLNGIKAENELLKQGERVVADKLDNHILHIREHQAELASPRARLDPERNAMIHTHISEHLMMLQQDPMMMVVLGYNVPQGLIEMMMQGAQPLPGPGGPPPGPPGGNPIPQAGVDPEIEAQLPDMPDMPNGDDVGGRPNE